MHSRCLNKLPRHRSSAVVQRRPVQRAAGLNVQCSLGCSPQQPRSSKPLQSVVLCDEQQERLRRLTALSSLPNQADQLWDPSDRNEEKLIVLEKPATRSISDLDYLSELLAIQQNDGPKNLGFFGTRNMGMTHQKLVEILSYAMVSTVSTAVPALFGDVCSVLLCSAAQCTTTTM
eukprot:GHRQ01032960.1.p1 GENE.GHRQ01032960.1~~GHRQ01032960.1.p1  ORF type:complete len:175 (+),score=21.71 GHRQ01032960.1:584-1108(+)